MNKIEEVKKKSLEPIVECAIISIFIVRHSIGESMWSVHAKYH